MGVLEKLDLANCQYCGNIPPKVISETSDLANCKLWSWIGFKNHGPLKGWSIHQLKHQRNYANFRTVRVRSTHVISTCWQDIGHMCAGRDAWWYVLYSSAFLIRLFFYKTASVSSSLALLSKKQYCILTLTWSVTPGRRCLLTAQWLQSRFRHRTLTLNHFTKTCSEIALYISPAWKGPVIVGNLAVLP